MNSKRMLIKILEECSAISLEVDKLTTLFRDSTFIFNAPVAMEFIESLDLDRILMELTDLNNRDTNYTDSIMTVLDATLSIQTLEDNFV